jgi:hypothetical protein
MPHLFDDWRQRSPNCDVSHEAVCDSVRAEGSGDAGEDLTRRISPAVSSGSRFHKQGTGREQ